MGDTGAGPASPGDWHATALSEADNVATLLRGVAAGEAVIVQGPRARFEVVALEAIALCHKIALCDIDAGARVVKYGECIGEAAKPVKRGEWVHTHNVRSRRAQPEPDAS